MMNRISTGHIVLLALLGSAQLVDYWLQQRNSRRATVPAKPVERWENEGGALSPTAVGTTQTSQVPH
jgi:hypothetical protein